MVVVEAESPELEIELSRETSGTGRHLHAGKCHAEKETNPRIAAQAEREEEVCYITERERERAKQVRPKRERKRSKKGGFEGVL